MADLSLHEWLEMGSDERKKVSRRDQRRLLILEAEMKKREPEPKKPSKGEESDDAAPAPRRQSGSTARRRRQVEDRVEEEEGRDSKEEEEESDESEESEGSEESGQDDSGEDEEDASNSESSAELEKPEVPEAPRPFDPLQDLLGISESAGMYTDKQKEYLLQQQQLMYQQQQMQGAYQQATFDQTSDHRIASIKAVMQSGGGVMSGNMGGQQPLMLTAGPSNTSGYQTSAFGTQAGHQAGGINPQSRAGGGGMSGVYSSMQNTQAQQQYAYQQQLQQMYATQGQTGGMDNQAMYTSVAAGAGNSMALVAVAQQPGQQGMMSPSMMAGGYGYPGQQQQQFPQYGGYLPPPGTQNDAIPAMQAQKVKPPRASYRIQRNTKPTKVNADDKAFGPLLDAMKKTAINK